MIWYILTTFALTALAFILGFYLGVMTTADRTAWAHQVLKQIEKED